MSELAAWDLAFVQAAVLELPEYLLSATLYWQIAPPGVPRSYSGSHPLTPGNFLLSLARLIVTPEEEKTSSIKDVSRQFETIRRRWRANWGKKADQEFSARLTMWKNSMHEIAGREPQEYAQQVRWRVLLQLLRDEQLNPKPSEVESLYALDLQLRNITENSPFVWDAALEKSFAREIFWFLYVRPAAKK
jgi:hypothetical protein